MAQNSIENLGNILFAQIERLSDESLTPKKLEFEANRTKSIYAMSDKIIDVASLTVDVMKLNRNVVPQNEKTPDILKLNK